MPLCDTLLRAAEQGFYRFYTSPKILEETARNLAKIYIKQGKYDREIAFSKAEKRVSQIKKAFPEALVEPLEDLIDSLDNDPKDRHVLAAAIEAQKLENNALVIIVTHNLKDFPQTVLSKYNVQSVSPDEFFLELIEISDDTEDLFNLLNEQAEAHNFQILDLLENLEKGNLKEFVRVVLTEYFLEEILNKLCLIIKTIGWVEKDIKFYKGKIYEMYLKEQSFIINTVLGECLIEFYCSSIIKNNISCQDVKKIQFFIQKYQEIT